MMSGYVVFGASGGVGTALTHRLRSRGANVVAAGRDPEKIESLAQATGAISMVADATDAGQVEGLIAESTEALGRITGIVNCVGSVILKPAHLTTDAEWDATIAKNLSSSFYIVRSGVKRMMGEGGSIVLVSTAAARTGLANHEAIAAAKAGVIGLMQAAAASYGSKNIRVNCVAPGMVDTPATSRITTSERALKTSTAMHALGRIGKPDDVASMIDWLLAPTNDWVTGQVFGVDGGLGTLRTRGT